MSLNLATFNLKMIRHLTISSFLLICFFAGSNLFAQSERVINMDIVAIDQPWMYNRLGAQQPTGMIFALKSDVMPISGKELKPGNVKLRPDKRPRPIVLRANVGDQLKITFTNLLTPYDTSGNFPIYTQTLTQKELEWILPATRHAGINIMGMQAVNSTQDLGSYVGQQTDSGYVPPGESIVYEVLATKEGTFLLYSEGSNLDNNNPPSSSNFRNQNAAQGGGQSSSGLFGSINIHPKTAEYYRSQVTWDDLYFATDHWVKEDGSVIKKKSATVAPDKVIEAFPVVNYKAKYPSGHKYAGKYILKMLDDDNNLLYTDLTAIITGPNAGNFDDDPKEPSFNPVPASPKRYQPFREFSMHYHQAHYGIQAFPDFYSDVLNVPGQQGGMDRWAINYGSGGIGAEIYANRIGVGPMANCIDCAYEEFFLSSWAVGDPATVVDVPANTATFAGDHLDPSRTLFANTKYGLNLPGRKAAPKVDSLKATRILYPDDPSNTYFSYMNDHVKFRVHHGSTGGVTHVHHQHAHQWLHSPNSPDGHYLDSQTLNPGASYTMEMVYNGSGNRNKTVGDQIFHCHFYPHFAQGMWGLWRVLDVLEQGTPLDDSGRAVEGSRAYPDAEIQSGVPIPAVVPVPTMAMAPVPGKVFLDETGQVVVPDTAKNVGFPFWVPGKAGSRAPHPPMDFAIDTIRNDSGAIVKLETLDGGMPRHLVVGGEVLFENHNKFDWTKIYGQLEAIKLPEGGTPVEKVAMATHAKRTHNTRLPDGQPGVFILNGLPPAQGAPFADPAVDDLGNAVGNKIIYKAANIQFDLVLNKAGWHYPQQRIITLWGDVENTINGKRPPEPFFIRANSKEQFVEFWHTNLVPEYYEYDDFQVRTPTDIIGQHIHLVKFDVVASDGAANGWNYEDGTFSPDQVRERIESVAQPRGGLYEYTYDPSRAINRSIGMKLPNPRAKAPNPVWGPAPANQNWEGAQTTIQRWYPDPLESSDGTDRTVRTVFTHDHFGPSTHQQAGLYAGLLVEPEKTVWIDPVTGERMGTRFDGGPTSWQALIEYPEEPEKSYREFALEFQDLALAFRNFSKQELSPYPDYHQFLSFSPDGTAKFDKAGMEKALENYNGWHDELPAINTPTTGAEIVSNGARGTYALNYRNEPLPLRFASKARVKSNITETIGQTPGLGGDLSYIYSSNTAAVKRGDPAFNQQPNPGSPISSNGDAFRFPQAPLTPGVQPGDPFTPLLRAYQGDRIQIRTLVGAHLADHFFNMQGVNWLFEPSFQNSGYRSAQAMGISEHFEMNFRVPVTGGNAKNPWSDYLYMASSDYTGQTNGLWGLMRAYGTQQDSLVALVSNEPGARLPREDKYVGCPDDATKVKFNVVANTVEGLRQDLVYNKLLNIKDKNAMIYVMAEDTAAIIAGTKAIEPLVLRARAGECLEVTLYNGWKASDDVFSKVSTINQAWANNQASPNNSYSASPHAGFNVEKLSYNVRTDAGMNVGFNNVQTVAPGQTKTYQWYAGRWDDDNNPIPVEFGSCLLSAADTYDAHTFGLYGAVIIEPADAHWKDAEKNSNSAKIYKDADFTELYFQEFVYQQQDHLDVGGISVNYKMEPLSNGRFKTQITNAMDTVHLAFSNTIAAGLDPETPIFYVNPGDPVRMRLLQSYGLGNGEIFVLHGHVWQELPWVNNSTEIGDNWISQNLGSRGQLGSQNTFEVVIPSAGGNDAIPGDYLYRSYLGSSIDNGEWGILRVQDENTPRPLALTAFHDDDGNGQIDLNGIFPSLGPVKDKLLLLSSSTKKPIAAIKPDANGQWSFDEVNFANPNIPHIIKSVKTGQEITFVPSVLKSITEFVKQLQENPPARPSGRDPNLIPGNKIGKGRLND